MPDNPLAFPRPGFETPAGYEDGMTLRDWFAGQALAGLAAAFGRAVLKDGETQAQADARWSYARADAMIAERKK